MIPDGRAPLPQASDTGLSVFGRYVCARRQRIGLTQDALARDLAQASGGEVGSDIPAIEEGRTRIPSRDLRAWAAALQVNPRELALYACFHYEPPVYRMLFGQEAPSMPGGQA